MVSHKMYSFYWATLYIHNKIVTCVTRITSHMRQFVDLDLHMSDIQLSRSQPVTEIWPVMTLYTLLYGCT